MMTLVKYYRKTVCTAVLAVWDVMVWTRTHTDTGNGLTILLLINHLIDDSFAGKSFEGAVHLLGISHGSPTNPRAVHEVAAAVLPDAFAMEGTEDMRNRMRKAAGTPYLLPLLDKAMLAPIEDLKHAQTLLNEEERHRWALGLGAAGYSLEDRDKEMSHYLGCRLVHSELLAGEALLCLLFTEKVNCHGKTWFSSMRAFCHRTMPFTLLSIQWLVYLAGGMPPWP